MQLFNRNPNGVVLNANLALRDLTPGVVLTHRSKHYQVVIGYNHAGKLYLVDRVGHLKRMRTTDVLRDFCKRPVAHAENPTRMATAAWEKAIRLHEKDCRLLTRMGIRKHPGSILTRLFAAS